MEHNIFSFQSLESFFQKYARETIIVVGVLGAAAAGVYFYSNYRTQREQAAQFDFAECFQEFRKAQLEATGWEEVEFACKAGYKQHPNSVYAPFFLAMEAHSLAEQQKVDQAIETMQESIKALSSTSPFYNMYKIKLALMKLSTEDSSLKAAGVSELQSLADDSSNKQRDEAMYYLGYQYVSSGDLNKGYDIWRQLVDTFGNSSDSKSPWAEFAKKKLPADQRKQQ